MMKLNIQKWGNSAAVRLPSAVLAQMGAQIGDVFELEVSSNQAVLRVTKPRYKLADLLAETPTPLPRVAGWDELSAVGKEII